MSPNTKQSARKKPLKAVGVIGCGAIGTLIAEAVENKIIDCDGLFLYDNVKRRAETLADSLKIHCRVVDSVEEMCERKPSVIVEAASQDAAKEYVEFIVGKGIHLVVMSVGALLSMNWDSGKVHFSSGAIGGLDAISTALLAGIDEVTLTTRKNPRVFELNNTEEAVAFEGDAAEATRRFPREMNVAATLALVVKPLRVNVKVISDPKVDKNVHEINVKWKHGRMHFEFANDPHPENEKTSALAAWSAIRLLRQMLCDNPKDLP